jgi:STE24 endopeptidase
MQHRAGIWIALVLIILCSQVAVARAGEPPTGDAVQAGDAAPSAKAAPFDPDKAKAASLIQDPEAATRAYLDSVSPERRDKTKSYASGNYVLGIVDFVFSSALMILLIVLGISIRFRNLARRITRVRALQTALYWIQFFIAITVIQFPLTLYKDYYRERHYDLLTQSLSGFLADQGKAILIGCILGSIPVMILYGVLRRAPRMWWAWFSGVAIVFLILTVAVAPVLISPMFNKFTPIANVEIRDNILKMARDQGIPADEVYQVDASTRTDRVSAYVNGMLGTMRIVMFDNTLKRCTPQEIQMIMGHEMGHYVLNHIWKGVAFFAVLVVLGLLFVRWGFARVLRRWPSTGIDGIADVAGLPLLWLVFSVVLFAAVPIISSFTRRQEAQADDFGLDASREPDAAATTFLKLGEYRDLEPEPWIEVIFFDHPSGKSRIRNAMEWKRAHATAAR